VFNLLSSIKQIGSICQIRDINMLNNLASLQIYFEIFFVRP
jgi:hypothetical protein